MVAFGWTVLALLFAVELAAGVAAGVAGYAAFGVLGAVLAVVVFVVLWALFASPKARFGGRVVRPLVKALVFGACSLALVLTGHLWWGVALAVAAVAINALAQIPAIRALAPTPPERPLR